MSLFLFFASAENQRNPTRINAVLAEGATQADALAAAQASVPDGGTHVGDDWSAVQLADAGFDGSISLPKGEPIYFSGLPHPLVARPGQ